MRVKVVFVACLLFSSPGCFGLSFGGGSSIEQAITPPTIGKELEDLDAAFKRGVITKEEFDLAKNRLLTEGRKY